MVWIMYRNAHNFVVNYGKSQRVKRFFHTSQFSLPFSLAHSLLQSCAHTKTFTLFSVDLILVHFGLSDFLLVVQPKADRTLLNRTHVWSSLLSQSVNHINGIPNPNIPYNCNIECQLVREQSQWKQLLRVHTDTSVRKRKSKRKTKQTRYTACREWSSIRVCVCVCNEKVRQQWNIFIEIKKDETKT